MTVYAFRIYSDSARVLVEFDNARQIDAMNREPPRPGIHYERATAAEAHAHVRADRIHETALWIDEGRIRRASE